MLKKYLFSLLVLSLVIFPATPSLSAIPGVSSMYELNMKIQNKAINDWLPRIAEYTLKLLWCTSLIAFAIGCKDLAMNTGSIQLEGIVALIMRFAFITGIMYWLITNPSMLSLIPNSLEKLGGYIATGTYGNLSFARISKAFTGMMIPIIDFYRTLNWTSPGLLLVCLILVFFINCLSILFLTTIVLVRIEAMFILIGGLITAAFFVIGYFRDLFMGYIKALAMVGMKLLLLSLCLNLLADLIEEWKNYYNVIDDPAIIYDTVIPMSFALLAFYIVVKSVPQYAVAILTGHATADGGLAKAAAMAAVGTAATTYNVLSSPGRMAQSTIDTVKTTSDAAQAYKQTAQSVLNSGGSKARSVGMGAWEAFKIAATQDIGSSRSSSGQQRSSEGNSTGGKASNSSGNTRNAGDPSSNGNHNNAQEAERQYKQKMKGGQV